MSAGTPDRETRPRIQSAEQLDQLDFSKGDGLLPVIAQHALTGEVLMLAYANRDALVRTLADRVMCYFSRSRGELWRKGDTSGNLQHLVSLHADCDGDTVIARVLPHGPACHTGASNCFDTMPTLPALDSVILSRIATPTDSSYTQTLLADDNLRLKKLGEEAVELALACERGESDRVAEEAADLLYHVLVACRAANVSLAQVLAVLEARAAP
ncbi:MAG TPA: bifunctional phosphoribosyl-AMP cyclohydrolase/phosphoribosyl-ATP diphosphatase HisIE [Longimicrobiales bacterium]|nr:bifunctional phosphoribosyl-AMP cyclohydrolase/phosphoribosyl-ATP diphosphatase HisIE [Longimicrobiales bacterium]